MAYAKIVVQYADDTALVIEVGHDGQCHPDLLDELTARCRDLWAQTIGEAESSE